MNKNTDTLDKNVEPDIKECPKCNITLLMHGPGWGFCDNCVAEITWDKKSDLNNNTIKEGS